MTLADAQHMSPQMLASRLLGAAGTAAGYTEAEVSGNGGGMIAAPGLNAVKFYAAPTSAGFDSLRKVEGAVVNFVSHRTDATDTPHAVRGHFDFTRYLMLRPVTEDRERWPSDRECRALAPVAGRSAPRPFAVSPDSAAHAYFAIRAISKAVLEPVPTAHIQCSDSSGGRAAACADASARLAQFPIQDVDYYEIARCADSANLCVTAHWEQSFGIGAIPSVTLTIATDAHDVDPPSEFSVVSVRYEAGLIVVD